MSTPKYIQITSSKPDGQRSTPIHVYNRQRQNLLDCSCWYELTMYETRRRNTNKSCAMRTDCYYMRTVHCIYSNSNHRPCQISSENVMIISEILQRVTNEVWLCTMEHPNTFSAIHCEIESFVNVRILIFRAIVCVKLQYATGRSSS